MVHTAPDHWWNCSNWIFKRNHDSENALYKKWNTNSDRPSIVSRTKNICGQSHIPYSVSCTTFSLVPQATSPKYFAAAFQSL